MANDHAIESRMLKPSYQQGLPLVAGLIRDRQLGPAFSSSSGKYGPSMGCSHSFSKAVFVTALSVGGLVRSFHRWGVGNKGLNFTQLFSVLQVLWVGIGAAKEVHSCSGSRRAFRAM